MTEQGGQEFSLARFEAFSDGVFTVALTLLVIEIRVPDLHGLDWREALAQLWELWPQFVSFLASFIVIGIVWVNHHAMSHFLRRVSRPMLLLNLLLLLTIVLVPFATALLGDYPTDRVACAFYGFTLLLMAGACNILWDLLVANYIRPLKLLAPEVLRRAHLRNRMGVLTYIVAIAVSIFYPPAALFLYAGIALLYLIPGEIDKELKRRSEDAQQGDVINAS
ncbi:DUF1211 domain-containing protein [bacterium]|nr:DUF1211 domain-containing protein [bacterium]